MNSILLVYSETVVAEILKGTLGEFGFDVELADSSEAAHRAVKKRSFDLLLADFDLSPRLGDDRSASASKPDDGCWRGTALVRELRAAGVRAPILIYTDLDGELYETAALDAGADDYIVRQPPISLLLSRLYAHIRRSERDLGTAARAERRVAIGRFKLDRKTRILLAEGKAIVLASREAKLLEFLASSPSRVFNREQVLDGVWADELRRSPAALAAVLRRLRRKMSQASLPDPVENVRGTGFRLGSSILLKL